MPRSWLRAYQFTGGFRIVTSGLSNTVAFSEGLIGRMVVGPGGTYKDAVAIGIPSYYNDAPLNCLNVRRAGGQLDPLQQVATHCHFLGGRAWENAPDAVVFYTLLPPNSPSCGEGVYRALISATSRHTGGVNVSFLDGSVRFVSNSIDTRNLHRRVATQPGTINIGGGTIVPGNPPPYPICADTGERFSYGVWAELGAINSREAVLLP